MSLQALSHDCAWVVLTLDWLSTLLLDFHSHFSDNTPVASSEKASTSCATLARGGARLVPGNTNCFLKGPNVGLLSGLSLFVTRVSP